MRILGVFPSELLHDKSLLVNDGYAPGDVSGATLIVYTTEFESDVNQEVPWSTFDELIVNSRRYEQASQMGSTDTTHQLLVRAFLPSGSTWKVAPRSLAAGATRKP